MTTGTDLARRYRLGPPLGAGTYGVVYAATRLTDGAEVAIKTLRPEMTREPEVVRRFEQEAMLASRIRHPALIEVLEAGVDPRDGSPFIVQPLLRGTDLRAVLARQGRLPAAAAVDLMVPVMAGLLALHREGIVHRDVTPSNIVLVQGSDGAVVPTLIDFGVAKFLLAGSGTPRTVTGQWLGTPAYMAPEQIAAPRDVDARCDVWSVGVVLFELITGANPFLAPSDLVETLRRVTQTRASLLRAASGVSPDLARVIDRALEPDRERRWRGMDDFLRALFDCPTIDEEVTGKILLGRHRTSLDVRHMRDDGTSSATPLVPFKPFDEGPDTTPWLPVPVVAPIVEDRGARIDAVQLVEGWRPDEPQSPPAPEPRAEATSRRPRRAGWQLAALAVATALALALAGWLRGGASTYAVSLSVVPRQAIIEWNGDPVGAGSFSRELRRDGRTHTLQIRAPGHQPHTVVFRDSPPPSTVTLRPE